MQSLIMNSVKEPSFQHARAPDGSRLASCCPALQLLAMVSLQCSAELLAPLQGLSGLQTLRCGWALTTAEVVQAVGQLTGLRELYMWGAAHMKHDGSLMQLTQLKQLSAMSLYGKVLTYSVGYVQPRLNCQVSCSSLGCILAC